jgi:ABC-type transport system involved in multi-copper enzyme maturation permease subunit
MRALAGIILNTFREAVRQPFYYILIMVAAAAVVVLLFLPFNTFYNDTDMYKDLGLSFILLFVLLAGLLAAATGVAREVEDKTAQTILAKSLGRWTFIIGKYLGAMAAVLLATVVLGIIFVIAVYYRVEVDAGPMIIQYAHGGEGRLVEEFQALRVNQALTVVPGLVLIVLQVGVLSAVATALSTRFSPATSVSLSLVAFVVGHLTALLDTAVRATGGAVEGLAQAALTVLPFLEIFNINEKLGHAVLTPFEGGSTGQAEWLAVWTYVGWAAVYAAAYAAAAIALGVLLFRRRSLS